MEEIDNSVFRYYEYLPLELEPEYKHGYTCDMCSKDFLKGPFFHSAGSGKDLCISCGEKMTFSPFSALIGRVMVPDVVWKDTLKEATVVLCYQIYSDYLGCYFSDGSNLLITYGDELSSYYIEREATFEKSILLVENDLLQRFPWVRDALEMTKANSVCFHHISKAVGRSHLCFLTAFSQFDSFIAFCFSDGFSEVLNCNEGMIVVIRDSFVLSCLLMNSPVRWNKTLPESAISALKWFFSEGQ